MDHEGRDEAVEGRSIVVTGCAEGEEVLWREGVSIEGVDMGGLCLWWEVKIDCCIYY